MSIIKNNVNYGVKVKQPEMDFGQFIGTSDGMPIYFKGNANFGGMEGTYPTLVELDLTDVTNDSVYCTLTNCTALTYIDMPDNDNFRIMTGSQEWLGYTNLNAIDCDKLYYNWYGYANIYHIWTRGDGTQDIGVSVYNSRCVDLELNDEGGSINANNASRLTGIDGTATIYWISEANDTPLVGTVNTKITDTTTENNNNPASFKFADTVNWQGNRISDGFSDCYALATLNLVFNNTEDTYHYANFNADRNRFYCLDEIHITTSDNKIVQLEGDNPLRINRNGSYTINPELKIYVPNALLATYQADSTWTDFTSYLYGE